MDKKEKKVVSFAIDDDVKKLTITGENEDQQVVMREELRDEDLDNVAGGLKLRDNCGSLIQSQKVIDELSQKFGSFDVTRDKGLI